MAFFYTNQKIYNVKNRHENIYDIIFNDNYPDRAGISNLKLQFNWITDIPVSFCQSNETKSQKQGNADNCS